MISLKKILVVLFSRNRLNEKEINGKLFFFTFLKFKFSYSLDLPYKLGRTIRGVSYIGRKKDLYSKLVEEILLGKDQIFLTDKLHKKYKSSKDLTIKKFNTFIQNSKLKNMPLWLIPDPWDKTEINNHKENYLKNFYKNRAENKMFFRNDDLKYIESKIYSKGTASSHVKQIKKLTDNIITQGYKENFKDLPTAVILIKGNQWVWMISKSGNHRAHIKKELGYSSIRCKILKVVNYKNINKFHNVRNSLYLEKEASDFFDKVFEGLDPIRGPI